MVTTTDEHYIHDMGDRLIALTRRLGMLPPHGTLPPAANHLWLVPLLEKFADRLDRLEGVPEPKWEMPT